MLAGLDTPDEGEILVDGHAARIETPQRASELGFRFVHQELNLVPAMTALQNITLGAPKPHRSGLIDWKRVAAEVMPLARTVGITFSLQSKVAELSVGQRWLVSICRALVRKARLIVMDEPTASLSAQECETLFKIVRTLRADGVSVLYVSHRLDEILALCDRVTAFRNGSRVMEEDRGAFDRQDLVQAIVGGSGEVADAKAGITHSASTTAVLSVRDLARWPAVKGVSFDLRMGEVLGLGGLVGAGRTELIRLIYGADRPHAGTMSLAGRAFSPRSPRDAVQAGLGLVPEERRSEGLILSRSVVFNMALPSNGRFATAFFPLLRTRERARWAQGLSKQLALKADSVHALVQSLSGGNQQKVIIGRWIDRNLKVLILDEPTRGVDIGARNEIHRLIRGLAADGLSVLVVSSEPEELPDFCDRVLVLAEGRLVATLGGAAISRDAIVQASYRSLTAEESTT